MNLIGITLCGAVSIGALGLWLHESFFGVHRRIQVRIRSLSPARSAAAETESRIFHGLEFSQGGKKRVLDQVMQFLDQAGGDFTLNQLVAMSALSGMLIAILGLRFGLGPLAVTVCSAAAMSVPVLLLSVRRSKRVEAFRRQLPEAFDVMSRAVQAGQTVPAAFQLVAAECRPLIAREFACCCEQQNLGLTFEASLRELARRVPVPELHIFVIALIVQRQCGGSPTEVMNNMADLIRKRIKLTQRLRALTGEGRMQAITLTLLPVGAFVGLLLLRPDYVDPLIERPQLLGGIVAADLLGCLWIRRIMRLDF